jgi:serpin B
MKTMNIVLSLMFLFAVILGSCEKKETAEQPEIDFRNDKKASQLIEADNLFAFDLFDEVYTRESEENFMISPLSVSIALGMTYNGAEGETKSAFEETLRLSGLSRHEINKIHGALIAHLMKADPKVTMEIANSIWVNQIFSLMQEFADTNRHYYDAQVASLDFNGPSAADIINDWVSDKTHEKITSIIESIPPQTAMYLINALYFYGTWKYAFDEKENLPVVFNYEDGSYSEVEAMRQKADLSYFAGNQVRMLELPYGDGNFSMHIMLPAEGYKLNDVIQYFTIQNWKTWQENLAERSVNLVLPKFKFEYKSLLNEHLKSMGMEVAFDGRADFSSMIQEPADLYISRVIHKTFIDVNEKGTEAAAVTAVEVGYTSVGPGDQTIQFIVDQPFIYAITEKTSNAVVFMGKVGNPEYE